MDAKATVDTKYTAVICQVVCQILYRNYMIIILNSQNNTITMQMITAKGH